MTGLQSMAAILSLTGLLSPFLERGTREVHRGLEDYRNRDWVGAIEHFQEAADGGENPVADYNLGAAAYEGENYPKALSAFERAARSPEIPPARSTYDLGNARYRSGDLAGALSAYREALRRDPTDEDARWNYELTLRQLQSGGNQDQERQPQPGGDRNQKGSGDRKPAGSDSTGTSPPSSGGEGQEAPADSSGPRDSQEAGSDSSRNPQAAAGDSTRSPAREPPTPGQAGQPGRRLTPEEARQLLNAVTPEERELLRARLKPSRRRHVEKDW